MLCVNDIQYHIPGLIYSSILISVLKRYCQLFVKD